MSDLAIQRELRELNKKVDRMVARTAPGVFVAWTPTYTGLGAAGSTTYSVQLGAYTRIGNVVIAHGRIAWTNATGTGAAFVTLPIAAVFTNVSRYVVTLYPIDVTFASSGIVGVIDSGTSTLGFVINSPASNSAGSIVTVETAGDLSFCAIYEVV